MMSAGRPMTPTLTPLSSFPCHECCTTSQPSGLLLQVCLVACRKVETSVHAGVLGRVSRSATVASSSDTSTAVHECPRMSTNIPCGACQETPSSGANDFISIHRLTTTSSAPYMTSNQARSLPVKRALSSEQKTTSTRTSPSHHHTVHLDPDSLPVSPKAR